jgi:hypothetical protein
VAARAVSYWLIIEALLQLKLPVATQTAILIGRHIYPPLLQKRRFLLFRALRGPGLRYGDLFLFSALPGFEFAIQIDTTYLKGWAVSLQYMFIPAVGVYEGTAGTVKNNPVVNQRISAHSAIHLLTSYDVTHEEPCPVKARGSVRCHFQYRPNKKQNTLVIRH